MQFLFCFYTTRCIAVSAAVKNTNKFSLTLQANCGILMFV